MYIYVAIDYIPMFFWKYSQQLDNPKIAFVTVLKFNVESSIGTSATHDLCTFVEDLYLWDRDLATVSSYNILKWWLS